MAKFCGKCGQELDGKTGLCPQCDQNTIKHKKKVKRRVTAVVAIICCTIVVVAVSLFAFWFYPMNNSAEEKKQFDENNIGEVYYHQTEEEHIASNQKNIMYADNELLLVSKEDIPYKDIEKLAQKYNAEIVGWIEQTGDYQLKLEQSYSDEELESIAESMEQESCVEYVYLNYVFELGANKTESRNGFIYGEKWEKDLQNFNNCKGKSWGLEAVGTLAAWDVLDAYSNQVNPVRVGLIDNGFDTNHEDLGFAQTFYNEGYDETLKNSKDGTVNHGTHVAGTMAAKSNNQEGICGVYPYGDGNLYGVSFVGTDHQPGNSDYVSTSMHYKIAYSELILRNVKVINNSIGFGYTSRTNPVVPNSQRWNDNVNYLESNSYILADFLQRLIKKGFDFVLVCSAGNDSAQYDSKYNSWTNVISKEDYPDVYNRIIVVGSINSDYKISDFSNGGDRVDVYAPGEIIYSTVYDNKYNDTYKKYDNKKYWSGTSMAAPHVSGIAAMAWSVNNNLTGEQIKQLICKYSSFRCQSCKLVDGYCVVSAASRMKTDADIKKTENGGFLCWVVDSADENIKIENATATFTNTKTKEAIPFTSDVYGHIEAFLPEGTYTLSVQAKGYSEYIWPGDNKDLPNPIVIKNNGVYYPSDWIKLHKKTSSSKLEYEMREEVIKFPVSDGTLYYSNTVKYPYFLGNSDVEKTINSRYAKFIEDFKNNDTDYDEVYESVKQWSSPDNLPYYDNITAEVTYNKNGAVSIKEVSTTWSGGAHPYSTVKGVTYDIKSGSKLEWDDIIKGSDQAIDKKLKEALEKAVGYSVKGTMMQTLKESTGYSLCDKGLCFYYNVGDAVDRAKVIIEYTDKNSYLIKLADTESEDSKELTEKDLKAKAEEHGLVSAWGYTDYDGNGKKEAFAIITDEDMSILKTLFISDDGSTRVMEDNLNWNLYQNNEGYIRFSHDKGFFWADMGAYGSGHSTIVYSVKNNSPYILKISSDIQGFYQKGDILYTTKSEYLSEGGHIYPEYELVYDSSTQEFSVGNKIEVEE